MAYNPYQYYEKNDDGLVGSFNEAAFQMLRIHYLQHKINLCNINPLAIDLESGMRNFEVMFQCIEDLYCEVDSKLTEIECLKGRILRMSINQVLSNHPVVLDNNLQNINKKNWSLVKDKIFAYRLFVRKLLESHGLVSQYAEDDSGL